MGLILIVGRRKKWHRHATLQEHHPLLSSGVNEVPEEEGDMGASLVSSVTMPTSAGGQESKSLTRFVAAILLLVLSCVVVSFILFCLTCECCFVIYFQGVVFVSWNLIGSSEVTGLYVTAGVLDITTNFGQVIS